MNSPQNTPPLPSPADQSAEAIRNAIDAAFALGVPHNYGRSRGLRRMREPRRLVFIGHGTQDRPQWLAPHAARAWLRMCGIAASVGVELQVVSGFRSVAHQLGILRRKLESGQSIEQILRVSAAPGYSEHHSGRAVDVTTPGFAALEEEFEQSVAFAWLSTNAQNHGFHLSYPRGNRHGIAYEPWHWCFRDQRRSG